MTRFVTLSILVIIAVLVSGCGTMQGAPDADFKRYNKNTRYHIDEKAGGFVITVKFTRYQIIPDRTGVGIACRKSLRNIAEAHAGKTGHSLFPLSDRQIRTSISRDRETGITSCVARVAVTFRDENN